MSGPEVVVAYVRVCDVPVCLLGFIFKLPAKQKRL